MWFRCPAFRFSIVLAVALVGAGAHAVEGQTRAAMPSPLDSLPIDPAVRTGTLANGFRYVIRRNAWPENRAELRLVVNAGSMQEDDDQRGLAHFVEHMAFNGTRRFARQALVDYIERIGMQFGAHLNAGTSFDETTYQLQIPTDTAAIVDTAFLILEEWAHGVTFDPAEVEKERGVVIEEWRLGLGADQRMFDKQLPVLLQGSRYTERLPIGDRPTLESFPREALLRFYRDWYRPDLMGVVVVGDVDVDRIESLIRERFSGLAGPSTPRPREVYPVPPHAEPLVSIATDAEATGSQITIYEKTPPARTVTVGDFRDGLLQRIDDALLNLRLFELTKQAEPPFIGAGVGGGNFVRSADVEVVGVSVRDGGVVEGLTAALSEVERVQRFGYTDAELARAKEEVLRGFERAWDERERTPSSRYAGAYVDDLLTGEISSGIDHDYTLAQVLLPTITLDELNASARARRSGENQVVLVNAPESAAAAVPDAAVLLQAIAAVGERELAAYEESLDLGPLIDPMPTPGRIVAEKADSVSGTVTWTLSNGARVILRPTGFQADELLFRAWSPGGASLVTPDAYLNASLAPTLLGLGGIGRFDVVSLQKRLAGKAVSVTPFIGMTQEGLTGGGSPKDLETLMQLIHLSVTSPRADTAAFQGFAANVRASLANRGSDPATAFQDTLQVTLTSHHPFTRPFTVDRVEELDLGQAWRSFQDRFGDAGDFTFLFVGRLDPEVMRPLVERYLASLPATGRVETWRDPEIHAPEGVVERIVRRGVEPKSQTRIVFTGPLQYGPATRDDLRWLSQVLELRLRETLREDLGGTYGVGVSASPGRVPREEYTFAIDFGSDPARMEQLVGAVFQEIDRLQEAGATVEDLAKVREADLRETEVNLTRNGYWLQQLAHADVTGEPPVLTLEMMRARVEGLTSERIREAARRYLDRTHYVRVSLVPEV